MGSGVSLLELVCMTTAPSVHGTGCSHVDTSSGCFRAAADMRAWSLDPPDPCPPVAFPCACCLLCAQTTNAVDFVKLLLDMREKYETTITHAFADDKNFKNTLNSVREPWVQGHSLSCAACVAVWPAATCCAVLLGIKPPHSWPLLASTACAWPLALSLSVRCPACCLLRAACRPQSFEDFVNKQPRSPEFVSLYIDELLRNKKQEISDADVEQRMDKVMPLFR